MEPTYFEVTFSITVASVAIMAVLVAQQARAQDTPVASATRGTISGPLTGTVTTEEYVTTFGRNVYL